MNNMTRASQLLVYYIVLVMKETNLQVDSDTFSELGEIMEIVETRLQDIEERTTKLEKRMKRLEMETEFNDHS